MVLTIADIDTRLLLASWTKCLRYKYKELDARHTIGRQEQYISSLARTMKVNSNGEHEPMQVDAARLKAR